MLFMIRDRFWAIKQLFLDDKIIAFSDFKEFSNCVL